MFQNNYLTRDYENKKSNISFRRLLKSVLSEELEKSRATILQALSAEDLSAFREELAAVIKSMDIQTKGDKLEPLAFSWAARLFRKLFTIDVEKLLEEHPQDEVVTSYCVL